MKIAARSIKVFLAFQNIVCEKETFTEHKKKALHIFKNKYASFAQTGWASQLI